MPHGSDFIPSLGSGSESLNEAQSEVREHMEKCLRRDLVGPGWIKGTLEPDDEEVLRLGDRGVPDRFYLSGYISPRCEDDVETLPPSQKIAGDNSTGSDEEFDDAPVEEVSSETRDLAPRSIGLSVAPSPNCQTLAASFEWGEYLFKSQEGGREWARQPKSHNISVDLESMGDGEIEFTPSTHPQTRFLFKNSTREGKRIITVRVVNDRTYAHRDWKKRAESTMHQMKITLTGSFQDIRAPSSISDTKMDLLYHYSDILSYGHNIGVGWSDDCTQVWSDYIPRHEVPLMRQRDELQELIPKFDVLTHPDKIYGAVESLRQFVDTYGDWIEEQRQTFESRKELQTFRGEFEENMANANDNIDRMRRGISLLLEDSDALEAYRLANKAIWVSQTSASLDDQHRISEFQWRPFQFAFQLINLEGIICNDHKDRGMVDLAWFPTGGGKTEAYLGLIALLSFYRRINPERAILEQRGPATHTIMRYTLRLLTADQAGRLVRAIGAMNLIAKENSLDEGFAPFRVGMWIGAKSSPNRLFKDPNPEYNQANAAHDLILDAQAERPSTETSVAQFQNCPWCGDSSIGEQKSYSITSTQWSEGRPTLHISCDNANCPFHNELPYTCVDDDIYLNPPTVLLATADKFVQIAYNHNAKSIKHSQKFNSINGAMYTIRRMLGFDNSTDSPPPPDLVIQDELHLLTGPLGTVAGLFETGLDLAWHNACNGHRLKYIAATATIRGAERDVGLMYGRGLNIFPPPLLKASDNFFAEEMPVDKMPGRVHLGIQTSPGKNITATDQTAASILQSIGSLRHHGGTSDNFLDPYWTLVMYYNSLRELGAGQSSLSQNIPRWMVRYSGEDDTRPIRQSRELTSRRSSSELTQYRSHLNLRLADSPGTVDVLNTSNMFQVGIDIPRLGAMMIVGQPRSNSEYIQSSGRVGRGPPGIVLSVLRGTYPRDQSHYELFRAFHQEFYRHVDRTSITPFAHRALDRAFETTLMMMLRMSFNDLSESDGPTELAMRENLRDNANSLIQKLHETVRERMKKYEAEDIDEEIVDGSLDVIETIYGKLKNHSRIHARESNKLHWLIWNELQRGPGDRSFFSSPFRPINAEGDEDYAMPISSMRDVSEEILMFEQTKQEEFKPIRTLPESHLFGHASPGSIWEQGGAPYMTGGISLWQLDTHDNHAGALMDPGVDPRGLVVDEPMLNQIFGERKFLLLPKATSRDKESKFLRPKTPAVRHQLFPRNWVCSDSNVAHIRNSSKFDKEKNQRVCIECNKPTAPSRFISACKRGHIESFDYHRWAHYGSKKKCNYQESNLVIEFGPDASFTLRDWVVRCLTCNSKKDLNDVTHLKEGDPRIWNCNGRKPWLHFSRADEGCDQKLENKEVGNTAVTFNETASLMLIPPYVTWHLGDQPDFQILLDQESREMMFEAWDEIQERPTQKRVRDRINHRLKDTQWSSDHTGFLERLDEYRELNDGSPLTIETLKTRERRGFVLEDVDLAGIDPERFQCRPIAGNTETVPGPWSNDQWPILSLTRVDRLTELKVIHGLKRIDPNSEFDAEPIDAPPPVRDGGPRNTHGIAMYNYGEGVYIDIKPEWLQDKASRRAVQFESGRASMKHSLSRVHKGMRRQNPVLEEGKSPLAYSAFTVLHTLSHLVIREFSKMSGFSLGSIRERLYLDFIDDDNRVRSCGLLIYTSGASTDGTLGGLVQQASSIARIENVFKSAMEALEMCSNDPVCKEHEPVLEEPNGAACHSCVLLPETSCEFQNQMLDRNWGGD